MAIRQMTDKTGKRIAAALEKQGAAAGIPEVKIPHVTDFDFLKLCTFAFYHGHYNRTEMAASYAISTATNTPYLYLLEGMKTLSDFEEADGGRIAYASTEFLRALHYELSTTRLNQFVSLKDGKINGINGCAVKEIGSEHMPAGTAFLILGSDMVKALNELEAAGQLNDETALNAVLEEHADSLYFHGEQPWLRTLDCTIERSADNKITITINQAKDETPRANGTSGSSLNKWIFICADNISNLPDTIAGTTVDITTSTSVWFGGIPLEEGQTNCTVLADNQFQIDLTALSRNTALGGISRYSVSTNADDLHYCSITEVLRSMKPLGVRTKYF